MRFAWRPKKYVQVQLYDYPKLYTYKFRNGKVGEELRVMTRTSPGAKRATIKKLGRGRYLGKISSAAWRPMDEERV